MRSERWNDPKEIKRFLTPIHAPGCSSGPILYSHRGVSYVDDSSRHCCLVGNTGTGKSETATALLLNILTKGESLVVVDPKSELYHRTAFRIPDHYNKFVLDFRHPSRSPDSINLLSMIRGLLQSGDPDDETLAAELLNEIGQGIYPIPPNAEDPFWLQSSSNYFQGLVHILNTCAAEEEIHISSIARMMQQADVRFAAGTYLKELYEMLPDDHPAKGYLNTYVNAPNDTRASIMSVATNGIHPLVRSKGMLQMLSKDTLTIQTLDVTKPFAIFIILPEETSTYDTIAGLVVRQLSHYLNRRAHDLGGRLPIRCNFILEELSTVGKSLTNLDRLMAIGRGLNIRMFLLLQSYSQLKSVYGEKADDILSCVGTTIGFSSSNFEMLTLWSKKCGERIRECRDHRASQPLITPVQLAAMPVGTALVMMDSHKFISHLPRYSAVFDVSDWQPPEIPPSRLDPNIPTFNLVEYVKEEKRNKLFAAVEEPEVKRPKPNPLTVPPRLPDPPSLFDGIDLDAMMKDIDAKIAELDAEEARRKAEERKAKQKARREAKKGTSSPKQQVEDLAQMAGPDGLIYQISILDPGPYRFTVANVVSREKDVPMSSVLRRLDKTPLTLSFPSREVADKVFDELKELQASLTRSVISVEDL